MSEYVYGRHVLEALTSDKAPLPEKVYILVTAKGPIVNSIINNCRVKKIPFNFVPKAKLDFLAGSKHQGVVAKVAVKSYVEFHDLIQKNKPEKNTGLCLIDEVNDPHNVGAIIRSAAAFNFRGVILPKHRSVGLTHGVMKSSAGALACMDVCRVNNTVMAMEELKKSGYWVYGADMEGQDIESVSFTFPLVLVMGGEHKGLRPLVKSKCDFLVSVPQERTNVESLNVSVAAGILFYRIYKKK